jgi:hypothetical protein
VSSQQFLEAFVDLIAGECDYVAAVASCRAFPSSTELQRRGCQFWYKPPKLHSLPVAGCTFTDFACVGCASDVVLTCKERGLVVTSLGSARFRQIVPSEPVLCRPRRVKCAGYHQLYVLYETSGGRDCVAELDVLGTVHRMFMCTGERGKVACFTVAGDLLWMVVNGEDSTLSVLAFDRFTCQPCPEQEFSGITCFGECVDINVAVSGEVALTDTHNERVHVLEKRRPCNVYSVIHTVPSPLRSCFVFPHLLATISDLSSEVTVAYDKPAWHCPTVSTLRLAVAAQHRPVAVATSRHGLLVLVNHASSDGSSTIVQSLLEFAMP